MTKILVFGSSGLVGSRFTDLYHKENPTITPRSKELDITSEKSVDNFFKDNKNEIKTVINFAAYTDVDEAEKQRNDKTNLSWQINVEGAKNVALAAKRFNKFLIHISTDFVFPGSEDNPGPYDEDAKTPEDSKDLSWYGWTKLLGEREVEKVNDNFAIVRISSPYRAHFPQKLDIARRILTLYDEGKLYPMFADRKFTPTFIDEASRAFFIIMEEELKGFFHVASSNVTTPYEFASYLLEKARGVKDIVKKGSIEEFLKKPGSTPRARLGGLGTKKTQKALDTKFATWQESLDEFIRQVT